MYSSKKPRSTLPSSGIRGGIRGWYKVVTVSFPTPGVHFCPPSTNCQHMNRPLSAIVGGFVGTAAMSVVLTILELEVRYGLGVFDAIARFVRVPGDPVLGFAIYVMVGTFGWPLLFLSLERYVPLSLDPAVAGTLLGTVLWFGFAVIGRGGLGGALLAVYLAATLV